MNDARKPDPYGVEAAAAARAAGQPVRPEPSSLFSSRVLNGVHVIKFSRPDVLDAYYIQRFGDQIYHHIKKLEAPRVVVDLDNVHHLSSAAIGMLIALRKIIEQRAGKICIANVSSDLWEIFKLTNLQKLLKIHDGTDKAVKSLS